MVRDIQIGNRDNNNNTASIKNIIQINMCIYIHINTPKYIPQRKKSTIFLCILQLHARECII